MLMREILCFLQKAFLQGVPALKPQLVSHAIILSYSGETGLLVEAARILNERKVPFISISNVGETTLARRSQATLKLCTERASF